MSDCEKHEFFGECESYCPWCHIEELQARVDELEEAKPDAAEIIELRKACQIYRDVGKSNRDEITRLNAVLDRLGDERWLTIPKRKGAEPENIHINKWFHMNINKWFHEWDTRIEYAITRGKNHE